MRIVPNSNNISINVSYLMVGSILDKFQNKGLINEEEKNKIYEDVRNKLGATKDFSCVI